VNEGYLDNIYISITDTRFKNGPTGHSIITNKYDICNDIENDPRMKPWKERALKLNFKSSAAFPIIQPGKIPIPLTVYSSETGFFDEDEIKLMTDISLEISFALQSFAKEHERMTMEEEVRRASIYNRNLLEASLDPLVTISALGKITDLNKAVEQVTGYSREELLGSNFSDYFTEPDKANEGYQKVFSEGVVQDYPLTIQHKSGKHTDVIYNAVTFRNEEGHIQGVFAAARDITELKRKEDELSMLNEDLNRSNQELEQFAYVASHDLQEPLRMVASFTQLLEKRYKDNLDDDAKEFIHYAVDGASRMQRLINDLLDYSRVTTRGKPLVNVDLSNVLGMAIANLHTKTQESGALIVQDKLPVVKGDETQLMRVFQNLIDNAIKFKGKEIPRITIKSIIENNKAIISVEDNGIGIDLKYKDRIFVIFQRLHSSAIYPGTGIGLAVCKRTIERHGGKIWFESDPGMGTIFKFSLNM
jgi:PAS domain S-box-containing protein